MIKFAGMCRVWTSSVKNSRLKQSQSCKYVTAFLNIHKNNCPNSKKNTIAPIYNSDFASDGGSICLVLLMKFRECIMHGIYFFLHLMGKSRIFSHIMYKAPFYTRNWHIKKSICRYRYVEITIFVKRCRYHSVVIMAFQKMPICLQNILKVTIEIENFFSKYKNI